MLCNIPNIRSFPSSLLDSTLFYNEYGNLPEEKVQWKKHSNQAYTNEVRPKVFQNKTTKVLW